MILRDEDLYTIVEYMKTKDKVTVKELMRLVNYSDRANRNTFLSLLQDHIFIFEYDEEEWKGRELTLGLLNNTIIPFDD